MGIVIVVVVVVIGIDRLRLKFLFLNLSQVKVFELEGLKCYLISGGLQIFKSIFFVYSSVSKLQTL